MASDSRFSWRIENIDGCRRSYNVCVLGKKSDGSEWSNSLTWVIDYVINWETGRLFIVTCSSKRPLNTILLNRVERYFTISPWLNPLVCYTTAAQNPDDDRRASSSDKTRKAHRFTFGVDLIIAYNNILFGCKIEFHAIHDQRNIWHFSYVTFGYTRSFVCFVRYGANQWIQVINLTRRSPDNCGAVVNNGLKSASYNWIVLFAFDKHIIHTDLSEASGEVRKGNGFRPLHQK